MPGRKGRPSFAVDEPWRWWVRKWLEQHPECSQAELARRAKITPATFNQLLQGKTRHSWAVPSINKIVGLPVPTVASGTIDDNDPLAQTAALMAQLDEDEAALVLEQVKGAERLARMLLAKKDKNLS